jgi:translation initiation factor IF-3
VIGAEGEQVGILSIQEALSMAREKELDLVEVAREADPPVCRIVDYGKHKYMLKKKQQETRGRHSQSQLKEVKFRIKIGEHDFNFKVRNIRRFIEDGDKVKVLVFFRGREIIRSDVGSGILKRILEDVKEIATVDQEPKFEGKMMWMMLSPSSRRPRTVENDNSSGGEDAKNQESPGGGQALQKERPGQDPA